jgi:RNA polymerase sigma-70 factor, ECF subfamily
MLMTGASSAPAPDPGGRSPGRSATDTLWGECIGRAARGDQQGLADLYDQSSRLVYSVAVRIAGNPADAEEITLDVYSQVWRLARDYTPDRGNPSSWLVMMTRSRALDKVRSRVARSQHEAVLETAFDAAAPGESAEQSAMTSEDRNRIQQAMRELSPEQREAIELSFFSGMTHSELADRLGQPLGTVMMRLRTALGATAKGEVA